MLTVPHPANMDMYSLSLKRYQEATERMSREESDAEEDEDIDAKHSEEVNAVKGVEMAIKKAVDHKLFLLQSVRDLIRFGLMDGAYFTRNVVESKVLSAEELVSVLAYYQVPDRGCGSFSTERRIGWNYKDERKDNL